MNISPLSLAGAYLIETTPFKDERGTFARAFCSLELQQILKWRKIINVNFSQTLKAGTIRGLHQQRPPFQEMKFIRCLHGEIADVIVDCRPESSTYLKWHMEILSGQNHKMLCAPEGFAHGFQALRDNTDVLYFTTAPYVAEAEIGIRYDDPRIGIDWPIKTSYVSEKDLGWSSFPADYHLY